MEMNYSPDSLPLIANLNAKLNTPWKTEGVNINILPAYSAALVAGMLNSSDSWTEVIKDRSLKSLNNTSNPEGKRIAQALVAVAVLEVFNDSVRLLAGLLSDEFAIPGISVARPDTDLRAQFITAVIKKINPLVLGQYAIDVHRAVAQLPDLQALAEEMAGQVGGSTQQGNIFSPALNTFCVAQNSLTLATHLRALTDSNEYLGTSFSAGRFHGEARLSGPSCSGNHLMFSLVNGRLQVEDFDSTNGTYVARAGLRVGRVESETTLSVGDVVLLSLSYGPDGRIGGDPAAMVRVRDGSKLVSTPAEGLDPSWPVILGRALQYRLKAASRLGSRIDPLTIGPSGSSFGNTQVEVRNDLLLAAVEIGFKGGGRWTLQISSNSNANNVTVTDADGKEIDVRAAKSAGVELQSGCTIAIKTTDSRMVRFTLEAHDLK
jgi:hypothetical protein